MNMLRGEVEKQGVSQDRILHYNFDSLEYEDMTAKKLFTTIKRQLSPEDKTYLFLNEIQESRGKEILKEIASEETRQREYGRLLAIDDNYPKYVLLNDDYAGGNYQGIKTVHIVDSLLSSDF